jgi:hypothetical protein
MYLYLDPSGARRCRACAIERRFERRRREYERARERAA